MIAACVRVRSQALQAFPDRSARKSVAPASLRDVDARHIMPGK